MSKSRIRTGCLGAVMLLAGVIVLATALVFFQGRRTPAGKPDYVALGSSYAAGVGLGPLQKGSPLVCARTSNGYPQQLARMRGLTIVDMTCAGATTTHVLEGGQFFQGPQIRVVDRDTRLVTITAGGNDIGYVGDLTALALRKQTSLLGGMVRSLSKAPDASRERDYARLQADIEAALAAIHARAPQATVVVATYPTILPPTGTCAVLALTEAEADAMREVADRLAATTRAAAANGGAMLVDMHSLGAAHNACSAEPWTRGWGGTTGARFHPTRLGAQATAKAIAERLGA